MVTKVLHNTNVATCSGNISPPPTSPEKPAMASINLEIDWQLLLKLYVKGVIVILGDTYSDL